MSDFFGGLAHGALALFGLGEVYDPLGKLRGEIADANASIQETKNVGAYDSIQTLSDEAKKQYNLFKSSQALTIEKAKFLNNLAMDDIAETNLFLTLLSVLVLVIIIYLIIT